MSVFGLQTCTLGRQHVAHEHAYHQLILASSGTTELALEHRGQRITRELGCLIPTACRHEYLGDGRNQTLVLDVPLAKLERLACADELQRLFERPRFFAVSPQLQRLTATLMTQAEQAPALHDEIATLLLRALYLQLHDQQLKRAEPRPPARSRLDLARLDAWIDAHLDAAIRVETLAELCALSPGHFHACFREATGLTPLAYVQRRRLDHARGLVAASQLSLGHIAGLVGFRDQGSFSRAYRRRFGEAPSQARR